MTAPISFSASAHPAAVKRTTSTGSGSGKQRVTFQKHYTEELGMTDAVTVHIISKETLKAIKENKSSLWYRSSELNELGIRELDETRQCRASTLEQLNLSWRGLEQEQSQAQSYTIGKRPRDVKMAKHTQRVLQEQQLHAQCANASVDKISKASHSSSKADRVAAQKMGQKDATDAQRIHGDEDKTLCTKKLPSRTSSWSKVMPASKKLGNGISYLFSSASLNKKVMAAA